MYSQNGNGYEVQGSGGSEVLWHARVLCGWEAGCDILSEHGASSGEHEESVPPRTPDVIEGRPWPWRLLVSWERDAVGIERTPQSAFLLEEGRQWRLDRGEGERGAWAQSLVRVILPNCHSEKGTGNVQQAYSLNVDTQMSTPK